jgi:hypothetical protein
MESRVVFVSKAWQSAATIESPLPQIPDDQNDRVSKHARKILIPNIGPRTITDEYKHKQITPKFAQSCAKQIS